MRERKRKTVESDPNGHMRVNELGSSARARRSSKPAIAADSTAHAPSNPVSALGNGVYVEIQGEYSQDSWSVDAQMQGQSYSDPLLDIQSQSSQDHWSVDAQIISQSSSEPWPVIQGQSFSDQWSVFLDSLPVTQGQFSRDQWSVEAQAHSQSSEDPLPFIQGQSSWDQWSVEAQAHSQSSEDPWTVIQGQSSPDQWSVNAQIQDQYPQDPRPQRSPPRRVYGGDHYGSYDRRREPNQRSLLVRNIPFDCRPELLRILFERFGPVRDVYIPKNYYTGEPRGFAFVQFIDSHDAAEARRRMNGIIFYGREISVVVAAETRKRPEEMRYKFRLRGTSGYRGRSSHYGMRSPHHPSGSRGCYRSRKHTIEPKEYRVY